MTLDDLAGRATITVSEVAVLLGMGRSAAYEAAKRRQIPTRRIGRRLVVPVPELVSWLNKRGPDEPTTTPPDQHSERSAASVSHQVVMILTPEGEIRAWPYS